MQLSKHLSLAEMVNSDTAKRNNINNNPTAEHLENMKYLAEKVFEPIREHFGIPILISSGYRSKALNQHIKGSLSSFHSKGCAIDIDMDNTAITNKELFHWIKDNLQYTELIWEFGTKENADWIHVGIVKGREKEKETLVATKEKGKPVYRLWKG
jgi:hypothetical protein